MSHTINSSATLYRIEGGEVIELKCGPLDVSGMLRDRNNFSSKPEAMEVLHDKLSIEVARKNDEQEAIEREIQAEEEREVEEIKAASYSLGFEDATKQASKNVDALQSEISKLKAELKAERVENAAKEEDKATKESAEKKAVAKK